MAARSDNSPPRRVVVTGIGIVSCTGIGVEEFCAGLRAGVNGKAPVTRFESDGFEHAYVCEVKGFDADRFLLNQNSRTVGRSSAFAVAASRLALEDAGIVAQSLDGLDVPVFVGTTDGEASPFEAITEQMHRTGMQSFDASLLDQVPAQEISLAIARELALSGEALTISTACAAGNYALGVGYDAIISGETNIALCGGSDTVCRKTFAGFYRLGNMATENCQPFDENRKGILTGEGSAILVLEERDHALKRGAKIYGEMLGYALNCDAQHMVAPNRDSIAACMREAHKNSGVDRSEVDFICMHGTGTKANDITESEAVNLVFEDHTPAVSSIKSSIGHGMGAASAFGAAACCLALDRNFLPPTVNLEKQDPACAVDVVANVARPQKPRVVQNNAFAFGGHNAIVMFRRNDPNTSQV